MKHKIIVENPCEFLCAKNFYKYCTEHVRKKEKILVNDNDMHELYSQIIDDYNKQPEYIPTYAVHMAMLTGMRVGEISALRWDCIYDDYILIDKSEKYNRKTKEYFIDKTKNKKIRQFPMTDDIRSLLERIKRVEMENGYFCEWIFANEDGRIHAPVISSCSKNKCRQLGIEEKGVHAYRRTLNSKIRNDGASAVVASALFGHSKDVNEKYYTYDVTDMETKKNIVSVVTRKIS